MLPLKNLWKPSEKTVPISSGCRLCLTMRRPLQPSMTIGSVRIDSSTPRPSSKSGSADVLEALGVRLDATPDVARRCLDQVGVDAPLRRPQPLDESRDHLRPAVEADAPDGRHLVSVSVVGTAADGAGAALERVLGALAGIAKGNVFKSDGQCRPRQFRGPR